MSKAKEVKEAGYYIRLTLGNKWHSFLKNGKKVVATKEEATRYFDKKVIVDLVKKLEAAGLEQQIKCEIVG